MWHFGARRVWRNQISRQGTMPVCERFFGFDADLHSWCKPTLESAAGLYWISHRPQIARSRQSHLHISDLPRTWPPGFVSPAEERARHAANTVRQSCAGPVTCRACCILIRQYDCLYRENSQMQGKRTRPVWPAQSVRFRLEVTPSSTSSSSNGSFHIPPSLAS